MKILKQGYPSKGWQWALGLEAARKQKLILDNLDGNIFEMVMSKPHKMHENPFLQVM
jgi:hypothetical protein